MLQKLVYIALPFTRVQLTRKDFKTKKIDEARAVTQIVVAEALAVAERVVAETGKKKVAKQK